MENPITPGEQQAMAEWRNSQQVQSEKPDAALSTDAVAPESPPVSVSEAPEEAPQNESLSQVTQSLEEAGQKLADAQATGDQVSQQAAETFNLQNAKEFLNEKKAEAWESAKSLADNALQTLQEKLSKVDKRAAFGAVWFGLHALIFPVAMAVQAEQLIPEAGNFMQGLQQVIESMPSHAPEGALAMSGVFAGLSALSVKLMERGSVPENMSTQRTAT